MTYNLSKNQLLLFLFLSINFGLRLVLSLYDSANIGSSAVFGLFVGISSDIITATYLLPIVLIFSKLRQPIMLFVALFALLFFAVSEFVFWQEFSSRFNFIAVDYLLYTWEVVGNIRESYNMPMIIGSVGAASLVLTYFLRKFNSKDMKLSIEKMAIVLIFPTLSFFLFDSSCLEFSNNRYINEISKNGLYELFSAYRNNSLSFEKFYITKDQKELTENLRNLIKADEENSAFLSQDTIFRDIKCKGQMKELNVIILTIESLSACFLRRFGNKENITPNLDRLMKESLYFNNMIATGTRTINGLSAITLSIPPLPGNAIARRPNNENLQTIGSMLKSRGYDCKFIYGGYGYFDNMNHFFENNGYISIDRSDFSADEITFSNIWGVCDEDLFNKIIKEADDSYNRKKHFFSMAMSTSNHRPYTYPDGKIDIPSKSGRSGAVKYTDYAIGEFLKKASSKPWFKDTMFVIIADHTANSAGKVSLDPEKYHIPCLVYSPANTAPKQVDSLASQIDIAPTILKLLNVSYKSKFFGHDILSSKRERAFISNYQQVGYMTNSKLIVLKPVKNMMTFEKVNGGFEEAKSKHRDTEKDALSYIQSANNWQVWNKE